MTHLSAALAYLLFIPRRGGQQKTRGFGIRGVHANSRRISAGLTLSLQSSVTAHARLFPIPLLCSRQTSSRPKRIVSYAGSLPSLPTSRLVTGRIVLGRCDPAVRLRLTRLGWSAN